MKMWEIITRSNSSSPCWFFYISFFLSSNWLLSDMEWTPTKNVINTSEIARAFIALTTRVVTIIL